MTELLRRWAVIVPATGLAVLGLLVAPRSVVPGSALPAVDPSPYSVCPVAEAGGGFSSRLGVSGTDGGRASVIAGGSREVEIPDGEGPFFIEVGELAELGTTPILVEASSPAAVFSRAGDVPAVSGCTPAANGALAILGMSTAGGDGSTLVLVNPFASEALVRLLGASEFGIDTPAELDEMTLPPATTVEVLLDQSMAGRQSLSFGLVVDSGLVAAGMKSSGPTDVAMSEAVAGSTQWFFALPDFGFDGDIHLRSLADVDTAFRVDRIQPDGIVEGVAEGTLVAQTLVVLPVEEVAGPGSGIVVSAVEPVAAAIVYSIDEVRAVAPGIAEAASTWSVPVSAILTEGQTTLWILNTSGEPLTAQITRPGVGACQTADLPAGMTTGVFVTGARGGAIDVSADGSIVVFYGVLSGNSVGMSAAVPLG